MSYTVSQLGKRCGLSRSTLLYYDRTGLLTPSARSGGNYRLYSEADLHQLQKIVMLRQTGMSLQAIQDLLNQEQGSDQTALLEAQLEQLNQEINRLRKQQHITLELLKGKYKSTHSDSMTKQQWSALLEATGMTDDDMWLWHAEFEARMPQAHQSFLESLAISPQEITRIRNRATKPKK